MNKFVFLFVIALCGTYTSSLNIESTNRMTGGTPVADNQLRSVISLQQRSQLSNYTRGHKCGGALVTLRHAVTAASCIQEIRNGIVLTLNPSEYRVFAGAAVLTNDSSADRHRGIEHFTVHPNFNANSPYVNNIAVITLDSEFPSNAVALASLAVSDPTTVQGPVCTSSGWGTQNQTSSVSVQLMQASKMVYEQPACQIFYSGIADGIPQINIRNDQICAIDPSSAACTGDLGNALVCNGNLNGILIYHAADCSGIQASAGPEIYTRITSFRTWIEATAGASTFQPGMAVLALISIVQIVKALN